MIEIDTTRARRLALLRAGLLKPEWTQLPASGKREARAGAHRIIDRFGYLQLDTVSIAGARSHTMVLLSRLEGMDPELGESLLSPGAALFEYWAHEASWIPMELYPVFAFRRRAFRHHPWWGDVVNENKEIAKNLIRRIKDEGPLRSLDMEGRGSRGWWNLKVARRVAAALWSSGELAIRERKSFQRSFDLTERVIPDEWRRKETPEKEAIEQLVLLSLSGHGWATSGTIARTFRIGSKDVARALERLAEKERILRAVLIGERRIAGWIRPEDLESLDRLAKLRPRTDRGVLLSPFDPLLWDRERVRQLFGFDQILEIFKPAPQRVYGYYCLPVLAGERLLARVDLKAERSAGRLEVLSLHLEEPTAEAREAAKSAIDRHAAALGLRVDGAGTGRAKRSRGPRAAASR